MPKFRVFASEEVFYMKDVEADDYSHAIEIFGQVMTNDDIVDGQGFTIEQVEEIENA